MPRPHAPDVEHILARQLWRVVLSLGFRRGLVYVGGGLAPHLTDTKPPVAAIAPEPLSAHPAFDAVITTVEPGPRPAPTTAAQQLLSAARDHAVVALLASSNLMDHRDSSTRRGICLTADLLGAVRLPLQTAAALHEPGPLDVLLLRRRAPHEPARYVDWETTTCVTVAGRHAQVNTYFDNHPDHVLGRVTTHFGPDGQAHLACWAPLAQLEHALAAFGHIAFDDRRRTLAARDVTIWVPATRGTAHAQRDRDRTTAPGSVRHLALVPDPPQMPADAASHPGI